MKNTIIIAVAALLLTSCGGEKKNSLETVLSSDNLKKIREKRTEIVAQQQKVAEELKLLDARISQLDTTKKIPLITTITANHEVFKHFLELQGNISTKDLIIIYPEYNGILTHIYVKEGQKVTKGQVLAKIDDGGLSQQLSQAEIQMALAKTTFERQARLWEQKIGSEIQYLQAKSTYEAQAQAVDQIKQQIAKTNVIAPFSGTIDDIITEQGSVVGVGQSPLMRIVNLNNMYIETEVPERYVSKVTKNKSVEVDIPVLGKQILTKIRQAEHVINPANRTFKVEIGLPNKDGQIKPNLTAKVKINDYTSEKALLIPQSIISENANGEQYIYVVSQKNEKNEGTAKRVIIQTGQTQGDVIEVLSGIEDGTEIIKEGARSVKHGQTVKVIKLN